MEEEAELYTDNRLGIAIVVGLLIIGFFYRSAVTEYLFGPSTAPVSPATRGARSSTASSQGGAIAANMSNDSPEIAEVRARRLKRFALDVPQAVSVEDPADTTGGGSVDVALRGEPDTKPKKNVFSRPALPTGATEIKDVAVQNISDGVGVMKPANTTEETSTHVEVADPIAVTPAVRAEEGQETSVPPMEEEVIEKTYTEEEQVRYIFGGAVTLSDVSAATLRRLLLREPVTTRSLAIAANWWMSAVHISALPRWEEIIIVSMGELLTERTPEEDLYTPAPEEEVARAVLELMGYRVTTGNRPQLKASDVKFPVSVSFIRALQKAGPECCTSSLRLLMSCFGYYQLDTLVPDFFDMRLLSSIRNDKCLGALVAGVMSDESRNTDMSNPGEFEKGVALSRLLSVSAIVPLSALNLRGTSNTAHQSQYPQMSYFSGMPSSPIPTKLWCTNPSLLLRHTRMITSNTTELLDLLHGLVERAAKQNRDAVLSWVAHFVQLNHDFFSIGGRAALYDDEGSNPESCSSSGILNLSYVLLKLMAPLLKNSKQFVPSVDWEYTKDDSRIRFSRLPNMVDGSKPGMAAIAIGNQSETSDGMAGCGSSPQIHNNNRNYSFSTELFWLTARAMELVDKISTRRQEQMRSCWDFFDHAKQLYTTNQSSHSGAVLEHARQCLHTFHYGWVASQLEDPNYLALACSWSKFVSDWILSQAAAEDATIRFYYIPAGLVKAMCDIWILTAHLCPDIAMPGLLAADAALLCVELMGRPDLASSPVVQDRLLAVVDAFVVSGKESLVGVVMNNQIIRESLAPAIMLLYSKCHAVAALDVNEDVAFDKNSIRSRANDLIKHLYNYPLDEPRDSIRSFVSGVGFEAFVSSAFDCIMYNFVEAVKTLKYNCKNEKMNRPVDSRAPNNVRWMLRLTASTFDVLRMLCDGESCVRDKMVGESLRYRVSSCIYSCLDYVNSAEKLELLRVKDPETWGYEESSVIGQSVNLLSSCLSVADNTKQSNFLAAFSEHPDFEIEGLLRLVELPGGSALKHFCTMILESAPKSTGGPKHSGNIVGASTTVLSPMDVDFDVFAEEEEDAEDIYAAFWMEEDQVCAVDDGFPGAHFFQRLHESSPAATSIIGSNIRAILKDYKKTAAMLPSPLRDATIAIRYSDEAPSYCRAFITGPVDTPYFCGVFVFDIFYPKDFPNVPPQVQFLNTGGGTERFHPNLYADGKVCVSLLGTFDGDSSERWDPKNSCLGQVLVSIQSLILGEYIPGAVGKHVTVDGRRLSAEDYLDYRLMTMRHAVISLKQGCRDEGQFAGSFSEFKTLFNAFFRSNRHRLLDALKRDIDSPHTSAMLRARLTKEAVRLAEELQIE